MVEGEVGWLQTKRAAIPSHLLEEPEANVEGAQWQDGHAVEGDLPGLEDKVAHEHLLRNHNKPLAEHKSVSICVQRDLWLGGEGLQPIIPDHIGCAGMKLAEVDNLVEALSNQPPYVWRRHQHFRESKEGLSWHSGIGSKC